LGAVPRRHRDRREFLPPLQRFSPIVQLFIGKGDEKIKAKTALFGEDIRSRVSEKAAQYAAERPDTYRDGFFYFKK
jgi:hypothetical protein